MINFIKTVEKNLKNWNFSGILDIGKEEDLKMIKDKLIDRNKLLVDLRVFESK